MGCGNSRAKIQSATPITRRTKVVKDKLSDAEEPAIKSNAQNQPKHRKQLGLEQEAHKIHLNLPQQERGERTPNNVSSPQEKTSKLNDLMGSPGRPGLNSFSFNHHRGATHRKLPSIRGGIDPGSALILSKLEFLQDNILELKDRVQSLEKTKTRNDLKASLRHPPPSAIEDDYESENDDLITEMNDLRDNFKGLNHPRKLTDFSDSTSKVFSHKNHLEKFYQKRFKQRRASRNLQNFRNCQSYQEISDGIQGAQDSPEQEMSMVKLKRGPGLLKSRSQTRNLSKVLYPNSTFNQQRQTANKKTDNFFDKRTAHYNKNKRRMRASPELLKRRHRSHINRNNIPFPKISLNRTIVIPGNKKEEALMRKSNRSASIPKGYYLRSTAQVVYSRKRANKNSKESLEQTVGLKRNLSSVPTIKDGAGKINQVSSSELKGTNSPRINMGMNKATNSRTASKKMSRKDSTNSQRKFTFPGKKSSGRSRLCPSRKESSQNSRKSKQPSQKDLNIPLPPSGKDKNHPIRFSQFYRNSSNHSKKSIQYKHKVSFRKSQTGENLRRLLMENTLRKTNNEKDSTRKMDEVIYSRYPQARKSAIEQRRKHMRRESVGGESNNHLKLKPQKIHQLDMDLDPESEYSSSLNGQLSKEVSIAQRTLKSSNGSRLSKMSQISKISKIHSLMKSRENGPRKSRMGRMSASKNININDSNEMEDEEEKSNQRNSVMGEKSEESFMRRRAKKKSRPSIFSNLGKCLRARDKERMDLSLDKHMGNDLHNKLIKKTIASTNNLAVLKSSLCSNLGKLAVGTPMAGGHKRRVADFTHVRKGRRSVTRGPADGPVMTPGSNHLSRKSAYNLKELQMAGGSNSSLRATIKKGGISQATLKALQKRKKGNESLRIVLGRRSIKKSSKAIINPVISEYEGSILDSNLSKIANKSSNKKNSDRTELKQSPGEVDSRVELSTRKYSTSIYKNFQKRGTMMSAQINKQFQNSGTMMSVQINKAMARKRESIAVINQPIMKKKSNNSVMVLMKSDKKGKDPQANLLQAADNASNFARAASPSKLDSNDKLTSGVFHLGNRVQRTSSMRQGQSRVSNANLNGSKKVDLNKYAVIKKTSIILNKPLGLALGAGEGQRGTITSQNFSPLYKKKLPDSNEAVASERKGDPNQSEEEGKYRYLVRNGISSSPSDSDDSLTSSIESSSSMCRGRIAMEVENRHKEVKDSNRKKSAGGSSKSSRELLFKGKMGLSSDDDTSSPETSIKGTLKNVKNIGGGVGGFLSPGQRGRPIRPSGMGPRRPYRNKMNSLKTMMSQNNIHLNALNNRPLLESKRSFNYGANANGLAGAFVTPRPSQAKSSLRMIRKVKKKKRKSKKVENALKNYVFDEDLVVGKGGFGMVKKAHSIKDEKIYAIKIINMNEVKGKTSTKEEDILAEVEIQKRMDHKHVLKIHESFIDPASNYLYIVLPFFKIGELFSDSFWKFRNKLKKKPKKERTLEVPEIKEYMRHLILAINYLHEEVKVAHRDLKPGNLLVDGDNNLKLIDFGTSQDFSKMDNDQTDKPVGTVAYHPPEILNREVKSFSAYKVDIWALGCIFYQFVMSKHPFTKSNRKELIAAVNENNPDFSDDVDPKLKEIIKSCLTTNPDLRPSIQDLSKVDWLFQAKDKTPKNKS